jgi:hypothetical protein
MVPYENRLHGLRASVGLSGTLGISVDIISNGFLRKHFTGWDFWAVRSAMEKLSIVPRDYAEVRMHTVRTQLPCVVDARYTTLH